jgi:DHA1 family bicyclomycin/chloramphenicol resistance-like MFS transporter
MPMLLAGRILQGAGAGCGVVLARAIARDVYGQDRVAQVIAYLTAAYVLGPMIAPPVGGQLTAAFGWRALFVLASIVGLMVIFAVIFGVPETRFHSAAVPRSVFAGYKSLLRHPRFVGFMLQPGLLSAAFYTQATAASFLAAEHLGADAAKIGWWFFAFPIGFVTGSFISGRIGASRSIEFMTILGGVIGVVNGALLVAWFYFGGISMAALYIPGAFVSLAQGLSMPYAQAGAMAVDSELSGSASGAVVFSQFFWPAALQQLTGLLADGTWVPMASVHFAAVAVALLAAWMAARAKR